MAKKSDGNGKSSRGFAAMDRKKLSEICSKGGKSAHAQGRAHEFTTDEARRAGKTGGIKVSSDRAHMAEIGRLGGEARSKRAQEEQRRRAQEGKSG